VTIRSRSVEQVQVVASRVHRVNQQLVPAVELEHHELEEPASRVEPEAELGRRGVVVQIGDQDACSAA
jgi:hypothetical protein